MSECVQEYENARAEERRTRRTIALGENQRACVSDIMGSLYLFIYRFCSLQTSPTLNANQEPHKNAVI